MITIDHSKCNNCSICLDVCPDYVILLDNSGKENKISVRYPDLCCSCGHCVAVCPSGAIIHEDFSNTDIIKLPKIKVSPSSIENLMLARRSTRCFKPDFVPDDLVARLVDVAVHSGSASNLQTEGFQIIRDQSFLKGLELIVIDVLWNDGLKFFTGKGLLWKILSKIYGPTLTKSYSKYRETIRRRRENNELEGMVFRNAPVIIIVHGLRRNFHAHANCSIAVRNMELLAPAMGLGACWVGFLTSAAHMNRGKINSYLELDKSRQVYGALMVGYPTYHYSCKMPRKERPIRYR